MTHVDFCCATCCSNKNLSAHTPKCSCNKTRNKHGSNDTDGVIVISVVLLSAAFVNECKEANKRKRWIEQGEEHGAYRSSLKRKVNKQQLTNQHSAFSATCCTDRARCYSDFGCATQQQPTTDVQQSVPQQGCATKVHVCHHG